MGIEFDPIGILKWVKSWIDSYGNYRNHLENICANSKFGGDWISIKEYQLEMKDAYVPLTLAREGFNPEALETILACETRFVIQGGPGSGKSTLARYIMMGMSQALLAKKIGLIPKSPFGTRALFPIKIDLKDANDEPKLDDLIKKSVDELDIGSIRKNGGVLHIFDGLDEITDLQQREKILDQIGRISEKHTLKTKTNPNYFIVTTRNAGYSNRILGSHSFSLYTLEALSSSQQQEMVRKYYQYWFSQKIPLPSGFSTPNDLAKHLLDQIDTNEKGPRDIKPSFDRLRNNPLMLSQIALMQYKGKSIPSVKKELYESCILQFVRRHIGQGSQATDELLPEDNDRLIFLGAIAFGLHQRKRPDAVTEGDAKRILQSLKRTFPNLGITEDQVPAILTLAEENWGILVRSQNSVPNYKFANSSFQEFLVANLIHKSPKRKGYWDLLSKNQFFLNDWNWWQEIALLYAGMPDHDESPADRIIDELLKFPDAKNVWGNAAYCMLNSQQPSKVRRRREIIEMLNRQVWELRDPDSKDALEILIQIEPEGIEGVLNTISRHHDVGTFSNRGHFLDLIAKITEPVSRQILRDTLISILQKRSKYIEDIDEPELIEVAGVLGRIGDTRLGQFCKVDGNGAKLSTFKIGQYPVTNDEYQVFVNETYSHRPIPSHWGGKLPANLTNHPVTNVSYEDARAYCVWLSNKRRGVYRLPTAAEWLLMAREGKADRRWNYPWSEEHQDKFLNYRSRYEKSTKTTPVGLYWGGRTPLLGIFDVLGNIWEWTSTRNGAEHIVKGLGWDTMEPMLGLNAVENIHPHEKRDNIGFRVLLEL